jgi:hypothetical protein
MSYFKLERGWSEHSVFDNEPLTTREAWVWLIEHAAWKDSTMPVGSARFKVLRGQIAVSVRYLAVKWQWSKSRVARFLDRLKSETMIGTENAGHASIITICNYAKYQDVRDSLGTLHGTDGGTDAGQTRDNIEAVKATKQEEREAPASPLTQEPHGKPKTGSRIPEDWRANPDQRAFAEQLGLNADWTEGKFIDHWRSATGAKARKADWDATWRNWCRNEVDRRPANSASGSGRMVHRQKPNSLIAAASAVLAQIEGEQ